MLASSCREPNNLVIPISIKMCMSTLQRPDHLATGWLHALAIRSHDSLDQSALKYKSSPVTNKNNNIYILFIS